jgi:hypothetical protein
MGNDWYPCSGDCGNCYCDEGDYRTCHKCYQHFCMQCDSINTCYCDEIKGRGHFICNSCIVEEVESSVEEITQEEKLNSILEALGYESLDAAYKDLMQNHNVPTKEAEIKNNV